ncbi:hypothetical protein GCM10027610_032210 [Dactylosporangium cerinum]
MVSRDTRVAVGMPGSRPTALKVSGISTEEPSPARAKPATAAVGCGVSMAAARPAVAIAALRRNSVSPPQRLVSRSPTSRPRVWPPV